jgi:ATP-binding cassette subfamily G (WHITE) protein 1
MYNAMGGVGYILGAAIHDKQVLNVLKPVIFMPLMLFTGFFISQESIPQWLLPFKYLSVFRYGY